MSYGHLIFQLCKTFTSAANGNIAVVRALLSSAESFTSLCTYKVLLLSERRCGDCEMQARRHCPLNYILDMHYTDNVLFTPASTAINTTLLCVFSFIAPVSLNKSQRANNSRRRSMQKCSFIHVNVGLLVVVDVWVFKHKQ